MGKENIKKGGHIHLTNKITDDIVKTFIGMGFQVVTGPEIENEYKNFDSLNVPKDHPSRDMQDTFWIKNKDEVLRTHTTANQDWILKNLKPPFKTIIPGKVFRNEATDKTHEVQFYQIDGFVVGENITMANLKHSLNTFLKNVFGKDLKTQFRPGFFPFVEPGIEIDLECFNCEGKGCSTCSHSGWIEILGAGMVHPNVLNNAGIDPKKYSGWAFGMGPERIAMLKYGISDVRYLYNGDLRVINQF